MYLVFRYVHSFGILGFCKNLSLLKYFYQLPMHFFILSETRKINRSEKQKSEALNSNGEDRKRKKKKKDESYSMFFEDSDSSMARQ